MATATQRVSARIPGKDDEFGAGGKYAFVEFEASNVAEFEKLIAEARKSPAFRMYDFDGTLGRRIDAAERGPLDGVAVVKEAAKAAQKKTHTLTPEQKAQLVGKKKTETEDPAGVAEGGSGSEGPAEAEDGSDVPAEAADAEASAQPAPAPSDGEKLSPRDIARQKLLARKKGA